MPTQDERLNDPKHNLEVADPDKPQLALILGELEQAQSDAQKYLQRNADAFDLWHSVWEGQTLDGRKHAGEMGGTVFPWEGGADGRMRTCERIVNEYIAVCEFAFDASKIRADSVRELALAREMNKATRLLRWQISGNMRANIQREIPLVFAWTGGYGSALIETAWEESRRLDYIELNVQDLSDLAQATQSALLDQIVAAIPDPAQEDALVEFLQSVSPILANSKSEARRIVRYLRSEGVAKIPEANVLFSRPRLTALRPMVDVLFPSEMDDPQNPDTRWMDRIEYITETEAYDRITTDGWDEQFVEEAKQHKGKLTNERWVRWTGWERSRYSGAGYNPSGSTPDENSYRDLIEIHHFRRRVHHFNTPCLYKTVFCPHLLRAHKGDPKKELFAKHGPDEYDHGKYPFAALRFEQHERPLLSSRGIPEIAYTWEQEEKVQADGMTDRTALVLQPPLIVPRDKQNTVAGQMRPAAILGVTRPNEFNWMRLPQFDNTPIAVAERIDVRIENYFPWFGTKVDPDKKQLFRQRTGKKVLGQLTIAIQQILELDQQYLPEETATRVTGDSSTPFHILRTEIQGAFQITASVDMGMLSEEKATAKLDMIKGAIGAFNQGGRANIDNVLQLALETIDPDLVDMVMDPPQQAMDRERKDEMSAIAQAFSGIEPDVPQYANHQMRLQILDEKVFKSPNQEMAKRLMQNPDTLQILQRRAQQFQDLIQQYQNNPEIGRAVGTQALQPHLAPALTSGQG